VYSNTTHRRADAASGWEPATGQRHSSAIVYALCYGGLSGLGYAAVMLLTDLPGLELSRLVWTSF
jgi:hypothetical protein